MELEYRNGIDLWVHGGLGIKWNVNAQMWDGIEILWSGNGISRWNGNVGTGWNGN